AISHARQPERHGRLQRNVSYLQQAQGALMLDGRLDPVTCRRWLWRRQDAFERGQHVTGCLLDALHASTEERTPAEAVARVALIEAGQLFNLHLELAPPRQAELLGSRSYRGHGHRNGRTADVACSTVPVSQGHAV